MYINTETDTEITQRISSSNSASASPLSRAYEYSMPKLSSKETASSSSGVYKASIPSKVLKDSNHALSMPLSHTTHAIFNTPKTPHAASPADPKSPAHVYSDELPTTNQNVNAATGTSPKQIENNSSATFGLSAMTLPYSSTCVRYTTTTTVIVEGTGMPYKA